jgi:hypothetical protein
VRYTRSAAPMGAMALWMLPPLAWMAQSAAIWSMLGLSALALAAPVASPRPGPR